MIPVQCSFGAVSLTPYRGGVGDQPQSRIARRRRPDTDPSITPQSPDGAADWIVPQGGLANHALSHSFLGDAVGPRALRGGRRAALQGIPWQRCRLWEQGETLPRRRLTTGSHRTITCGGQLRRGIPVGKAEVLLGKKGLPATATQDEGLQRGQVQRWRRGWDSNPR